MKLRGFPLVIVMVLAAVTFVLVAGTALAQSGAPPAATVPGGALVLGVLQWLISFAIKKWEAAYNFVIGWVVLLLSLVGYSVVPAAHAGLLDSLGPIKALGLGLAAVLQTAVVTGLHEWILGSVVKPLTGRLSKGTSYLGPK